MRSDYQHGSIKREKRKHGSAVWPLRWRESNPHGSTVRRKVVIGTVEQFRTKADAWKACEHLRSTSNRDTGTPRTMAELVAHYQRKEMSEEGEKSFATREAYGFYLRGWIVPKWGEYSLSDIHTVAVEDWLKVVPLAPGSRAKIRNLMSTLFNHAMRHEWTDRNPIRLVRQSAKRLSTPDCLTEEEIGKLLRKLDGVYHVMAFLAAVTGLRVSELLALKWEDIDTLARPRSILTARLSVNMSVH